MIQIYRHTDYRDLLRELADNRKADGGYKYADLARAIGIHAPYLSKVFRKEAQLSTDQMHLACEEFGITNEEEIHFIMLLVEHQRTGLAKRRESLAEKIKGIQDIKRDPKNHLHAQSINLEESYIYQEYYLDPLAPLVHMFLTVPFYAKNPFRICEQLSLPAKQLKKITDKLEELGMITFDAQNETYIILKDHIHLEKGSIINEAYQHLFRTLSSEHVKRMNQEDKNQFIYTFGADEETKKAIFDEFNSFLKRAQELVRKAPSDGVFQLNFDLFRWDYRRADANISTSKDTSKNKNFEASL